MKPLSLPPAAVPPASKRAEIESAALALAATDVDVWRVGLDDQSAETRRWMETLLAKDELERASRFYFERDRRRFIVGRALLRILLGRYLGRMPAQLVFTYGSNGKPSLRRSGSEPAIYFNVAHSEGLALYAFTRVGEIGIDVELMRDLPDWEQVAETAFSPHELAQLRACPAERRRDEFFRAWTRQEAVLKALGTGLSGTIGPESGFNVYPLEAAPGFAAALAVSPAARRPASVRGWQHGRDAAPNARVSHRAKETNFL